MCDHMELSEGGRVVIVMPWAWNEMPSWFRNCLNNRGLQWGMTSFQYVPIINKWFHERYGARYFCQPKGPWTVEFPNQETYMECVLTWS
jgi:hypothetical protein